jgi:saccharopine dehydrogenase (NADP+, L-glutamate forming)
MKEILVLGAGRSSSSLISYLRERAVSHQWKVTVGDLSLEAARQRIREPFGEAVRFDINDKVSSYHLIEKSDIVVSLLPATFHPNVAKLCVDLRKHFLSASYVSDEMQSLHHDAIKKEILLLNECGLDPGIDHMSAMQIIDAIKRKGGTLKSFESFTGGLIAPETDPGNPWRYKFTWNPRNVVMAGQGTAKFLLDGRFKYVPYQRLFQQITPVEISGVFYEGYPNRDSLKYLSEYGLHGIRTLIRGTLRNEGFCKAWNTLVQLGCCDDSYVMDNVEQMSHRDFMDSFLGTESSLSVEEKFSKTFRLDPADPILERIRWSGFFSDEKIGLKGGTPAQILEYILNKRWRLVPGDRDLIVMWHRFVYQVNSTVKVITSHLSVRGDNEVETAMAKTVGFPLAIAVKLLLEGKLKHRGVVIPVHEEIYKPILNELNSFGISLTEKEGEASKDLLQRYSG